MNTCANVHFSVSPKTAHFRQLFCVIVILQDQAQKRSPHLVPFREVDPVIKRSNR